MTTQLALFDYRQLDTETRTIVQQRTSEIKALMKRTAQDIIEIGQKLIEVKERLPHGAFGDWLESEFEWSYPLAAKFVNVANQFKSINFIDLDFAPSALYLLAAPSTPDEARQEAIERAQNGETITYTKSVEITNRYKTTDTRADYSPNGNGHTLESTAPAIPADTRPLFDDPEPDEALADESRPVCPECGQVYNGASCPDCRKVEQEAPTNVHFSSETDEWYTPQEIVDLVVDVLGEIDLDPCSNPQKSVPAVTHYTREDDGLSYPWHGRIYMNPPYGREIDDWVDYLCQQWTAGNVNEAIALAPSRTDTKWFRELRQFPRCFIYGRLEFSGGNNKAPFPSMAVYLGDRVDVFKSVFGKIGDIYRLEE